ncbi:MAG: hypothetical protein AMS18_15380 [Gemmatimonas sp. SG8_17]|nr:MAG: hypothetical protein AMS18_15380 [Gemmatimonas sp. SG8_17]
MKVLITGADGFVGAALIRKLRTDGCEVVAGLRPAPGSTEESARRASLSDVRAIPLELLDQDSVRSAIAEGWDAVVHLAAVASGSDAQRDPLAAWSVNCLGTARIAHELGEARRGGQDPVFLVISTAEVYGAGPPRPRVEADPTEPCSPYAASKLAAEIAALEVHRRTGLRTVVARAFPHTGPGQDLRFVVPAFAARIRFARRIGAPVVTVGNLEPVREFMHVDDVASAYQLLIQRGNPGEVYNVACGRAISIRDLFFTLADTVGHRAIPEEDHQLIRPVDIPYLVGDATKLREQVGWEPHISLEQTLHEVVDAQAD